MNTHSREELKYNYEGIVGESPSLVACLKEVDRAVDSDLPVLIVGELGTDKELIAKAIHFQGPRGKHNFVSENCAAISEKLLEEELFGYDDARGKKKGVLEFANEGTLFLDEISELTLRLQYSLVQTFKLGGYRVRAGLDEPHIQVLTGGFIRDLDDIHINVRLISATNRDLDELVRTSKYDIRFYGYTSAIKITVPPLRERKSDIPLLVGYFLEKIAKERAGAKKEVDTEVMQLLQDYEWPGNTRELENECTRIYTLSDDRITTRDTSPHIRQDDEKLEKALWEAQRGRFYDSLYETRILARPEIINYQLKIPIALLIHRFDQKGQITYEAVHLHEGQVHPTTMGLEGKTIDEAIANFSKALIQDVEMLKKENLSPEMQKRLQYLNSIINEAG